MYPNTKGASLINTYSNIKGIGSYLSDESFNTLSEGVQMMALEIALFTVSFGVLNAVSAGAKALKLVDSIMRITRAAKLGSF